MAVQCPQCPALQPLRSGNRGSPMTVLSRQGNQIADALFQCMSLLCGLVHNGHGVHPSRVATIRARAQRAANRLNDHGEPSTMSLGQELAPHLPFLRRYARALTGSQAHGDAFVRATLEAIVAAARRISPRRRSAPRPLPHLPRDLVDRQYRGRRRAVAQLRRRARALPRRACRGSRRCRARRCC